MSVPSELRRRYSILPFAIGGLLASIVILGALALRFGGAVVQAGEGGVLTPIHGPLWKLSLAGAALILPLAGLLIWSTRRLQQEWALTQAREQWLDTTLRSIGDAVLTVDREGRVTFMNPVAQQLTGWLEPEGKGRPLGEVLRLMQGESRDAVKEPARMTATAGAGSESDLYLVARDGTERAVARIGHPIRSASGEELGAVLILRDITEQRLGDSALRASQGMFRLISENVSDMIEVCDLQGRRLYNSASYERTLGRTGLFMTVCFGDVHADDRVEVKATFDEIIRTGLPGRADHRLVRKDGSEIRVESLGSVIRDAGGRPQNVLVVSRDITARRAAEEHARQETEFSDTLINSMPGIFYLCDAGRRLVRWNRNFEQVTGYTAAEISSMEALDFFQPEVRSLVRERMTQCLTEGSADVEIVFACKDGPSAPYYFTGLRVEIAGDTCVLGVGIDISERLQAEDTVRTTMRRLTRQNKVLSDQARSPAMLGTELSTALRIITEVTAQTLEVERASLWFYDDAQTTIRCSDLFEVTGNVHSAGAMLSAGEFPQYFAALREERVIAADDARTDARTREFSKMYLEPIGITAMLDAPIRAGGRMVGILCNEHIGAARVWTPDEQSFAGSMADLISLALEVAQRRDAERALREARDHLEIKVAERTQDLEAANERLQELDRLKSEFVATMSHELRTPLNSIIGFTGILRQGLAGPLNPEQLKQLGMVHFSARHLLGLINDLLDLSRIESGKMEVLCEPFQLEKVVEEVTGSLRPAAEQKKLWMESNLDIPEITLHGDRKKTFQVLLNLVNNAVKFTETGGVRIEVHPTSTEVTLAVIDTGIGIKPESVANLFQAFRQVDGSARRTYEGTGLGLYLCQKLATMLGGSIVVESEFGRGSRFTVTLPRRLLS